MEPIRISRFTYLLHDSVIARMLDAHLSRMAVLCKIEKARKPVWKFIDLTDKAKEYWEHKYVNETKDFIETITIDHLKKFNDQKSQDIIAHVNYLMEKK